MTRSIKSGKGGAAVSNPKTPRTAGPSRPAKGGGKTSGGINRKRESVPKKLPATTTGGPF